MSGKLLQLLQIFLVKKKKKFDIKRFFISLLDIEVFLKKEPFSDVCYIQTLL